MAQFFAYPVLQQVQLFCISYNRYLPTQWKVSYLTDCGDVENAGLENVEAKCMGENARMENADK